MTSSENSPDRDFILENACIMPFIGACLEAGGRFKPCCKYDRWIDTPNATTVGLTEISHSKAMDQLRADFLDGKKPSGCIRCFRDEESGVKSMRTSYNRLHGHLLKEENIAVPAIKIIDFGYGNTCNAACITCESSSSSLWVKDERKLFEIEENKFAREPKKIHQDIYKWSDEEIRNLSVISHAQNETLINPELPRFLNKANSENCKNERILEISTNAQYFPSEEIVSSLLQFERVELQISIDGVGEKNNYIRYPLNFDVISENVKRWVDISNRNKNFFITGRCTVSIYNVLYLKEVSEWWNSVKNLSIENRVRDLKFGYVWFPVYLSPVILPDKIKRLACDRYPGKFLEGLLNRGAETIPEKYQNIFPNPIQLFFEFTKKMDSLRGLDAKKTFPLLFEAFPESQEFSYLKSPRKESSGTIS